MFTPLTIKSAHSLQGNPFLVDDYVKNAAQKGYHTLVLNEFETLSTALTFYNTCLQYDVKPIIALSFYYNDVLISAVAQNGDGYVSLLTMTSLIAQKQLIPFQQYQDVVFWIHDINNAHVENIIADIGLDNLFFIATAQTTRQIEIAKQLGLRVIVSAHVDYLDGDDEVVYDVLQALMFKKSFVLHRKYDGQKQLLSANDYDVFLKNTFPQELITDTVTLLENLNVEISYDKQTLPQIVDNPNDTLKQLAYEGLKQRELHGKEYVARLEHELTVICEMNFADYFIMIWDIIQFTKKNHITLGAGRGSAVASLVLYCLGVTQIDPLEYQLVFERFLNPERYSMPDVDLDLPDNRRYDVINYVQQKYGTDYVAQIGTFQTFGPKGSLRELAKMFNQPKWEVDQWAKVVDDDKTLDDTNEQLQLFVAKSKQHRFILNLAQKIEKLPKNISKHAAGVVISSCPMWEVSPVFVDDNNNFVTQFTMNDIEKIGLLKMDFLGVRHLSVLALAQENVQKLQSNFDIWTINFEDEATFNMLSKGDTDGVFQFDSQGIRRVLKLIKPKNIAELAAICALYRPGPMNQTDHFYKRKFGKEQILYIHDTLKPILEETYGVIIYQEQIMQIAVKMAGFTLGQADLLRRGISKKKAATLQQQKQSFVNGSIKNGYTLTEASQVFDYIEQFAEYGFAKSHAVAYAVFAYQMAYIKTHFPNVYYLCLLLKSNARTEKYAHYITLAMKQGVTFQLPDINSSFLYPQLLNDQKVQLGLLNVQGIQKKDALALLNDRKVNGKFTNFENFVSRALTLKLKKETIERLIQSGSCDVFGYNRATLVQNIDAVSVATGNLFDTVLSSKLHIGEEYTKDEIVAFEKQLLGFSFTINEFADYLSYYDQKIFVSTIEATEHSNVVLLGKIKDVRKIITKQNKPMAFAKLEDNYGQMNMVVFSETYIEYMSFLNTDKICVIIGKVDTRNGQIQCVVQRIDTVEHYLDWYEQSKYVAFIKLNSRIDVKKLVSLLELETGDTPVVAYFENEKQYKKLSDKYKAHFSVKTIERIESVFGKGSVVVKRGKNE